MPTTSPQQEPQSHHPTPPEFPTEFTVQFGEIVAIAGAVVGRVLEVEGLSVETQMIQEIAYETTAILLHHIMSPEGQALRQVVKEQWEAGKAAGEAEDGKEGVANDH